MNLFPRYTPPSFSSPWTLQPFKTVTFQRQRSYPGFSDLAQRNLEIHNHLPSGFATPVHTDLISLSAEHIPGTHSGFICFFSFQKHHLLHGPCSPASLVLMFCSWNLSLRRRQHGTAGVPGALGWMPRAAYSEARGCTLSWRSGPSFSLLSRQPRFISWDEGQGFTDVKSWPVHAGLGYGSLAQVAAPKWGFTGKQNVV